MSPKLPRGFKADCQRKALELREALGLKGNAPLDAFQLAEHLGLECIAHSVLCKGTDFHNDLNCNNWSAVLVECEDTSLIIYNDCHSATRSQSSIMHEISHFILGHTAPPLDHNLPLFHIDHEPQQELEANTLSSILLLPRAALEYCAIGHKDINAIAIEYGISKALARKEINMSGILRQYSRWNPYVGSTSSD